MKRAALGLWMHSGWGVLVAVAGDATAVELMDRRRIVTADPRVPGANQPYHYAARLGLPESERYLANCAAAAERLASAAVADLEFGNWACASITSSLPPCCWHRVDRCRL